MEGYKLFFSGGGCNEVVVLFDNILLVIKIYFIKLREKMWCY